jgi:adenine-specific DNA methylase
LASIAFRLLNNIMNYDRFKRVIKVDELDYSKFCEGRNVDVSISLMTSTYIAGSHVICVIASLCGSQGSADETP